MKTHAARSIWMMVLGWTILPGSGLLAGYFTGRLVADTVSLEELYMGGLLGMMIGLFAGVFAAGILTALAIKSFFPISIFQIILVSFGWLLSYVIGMIVTAALSFLVAIPVLQVVDRVSRSPDGNPMMMEMVILIAVIISYPVGALGGGFLMGMLGGFITTRVLKNLEPGLWKKPLTSMTLHWGTGFAVGMLLGGLFIAYGIGYFLTAFFASFTPLGAIALATGFAVTGVCGGFIGGRFMVKRLGECASANELESLVEEQAPLIESQTRNT